MAFSFLLLVVSVSMEIIAANEISMTRVTIRVEMRENPWLFARRVQ